MRNYGKKSSKEAKRNGWIAEFSEHYFLASPTNVINWEITVHFPRQWVLLAVLFNGTTSFLTEKIIKLWLWYSVYLQPFCQLNRKSSKQSRVHFFCLSTSVLSFSPSELGLLWWCGLRELLVWASEAGFSCLAPRSISVGFANFILVLGV